MKVIVVPPKGDVHVAEIYDGLDDIHEILGAKHISTVRLWPGQQMVIYCDDDGALKPDRQLSRYVSCQRGWIELFGTFVIVGQNFGYTRDPDGCCDLHYDETDVPEEEIETLLEVFSYDAIEVLESGYHVYYN